MTRHLHSPLTRRRRIRLAILGAALATVAVAVVVVITLAARANAGVQPVQSVRGPFSAVEVHAEGSDVTIGYGDVDEPEIRFEQGHDARTFRLDADTGVDGVLRVDLRQDSSGWWSLGTWGPAAPALRVTLPESPRDVSDVTVDSAAGNVLVQGDFGRIQVTAQAGNVALDGSAEELIVNNDAGNVSGNGYAVTGPVVIKTNAGSSDVRFATLPASIRIDANVGDIDVHLPRGSYRILAEADLGDVQITAKSTIGADRRYAFTATVGAIRVAS